jgi:hypothetical protein
MRLSEILELTFSHLFGRLLRRAVGFVLLGLFTLIAIYHLTVAGTLALEADFGLLYARLIVAAIYAAAAAVTFIVLWATRTRPLPQSRIAGEPTSARPLQLAMLIEAGLLGYSLARKAPRDR